MTNAINTAAAASEETVVEKKIIKHDDFDINKDWGYLAEKEPEASHVLKAELMNRFGPDGFEITPKQVQVFLAMHRWVQKSDANQSRDDFRGRTWESVEKGYATLTERAVKEIAENGPNAVMVPMPNVTGLTAADILPAAEEAPQDEPTEEVTEIEVVVPEAVAKELIEEGVAEAKPKPQRRAPRKTAAQRKADAEAAASAE